MNPSNEQALRRLLEDALSQLRARRQEVQDLSQSHRQPLAIVGMGCRFPGGVSDVDSYWSLLRNGVDAIEEVPATRWDLSDWFDSNPDSVGKSYSRFGGFLERVDQFDAEFFGIAAREAEGMDPQQRLLLEITWEAIENSGIPLEQLQANPTGVFLGICNCDYRELYRPDQRPEDLDAYFGSGTSYSVAAGRVSYCLGLRGPSLAIDTACSSSLVAMHLACQSLRRGECHHALVGGVNLMLSPTASVAFSRARMLASDGRCKAFDASADGYGRGEGCGLVVLKRLNDAQRDGDKVLAIIRGSAINHDGRSSGLTAPNGLAQEDLIRNALEDAGCLPADVDYVEAHGTGTSLGDPIEAKALGRVFSPSKPETARTQPLWIGTAKTNIGHLEAAAGIAGVIKTVLSLQHQALPPNIHFHSPNPIVPWSELELKVPTRLEPWPRGTRPRIAGVSSFGFAGTNAHVVIQEGPDSTPVTAGQSYLWPQVLTVSAKSSAGLEHVIQCMQAHVEASPSEKIASICRASNLQRSHFLHRAALVVSSPDEIDFQSFQSGRASEAPQIGLLLASTLGRNEQSLFDQLADEPKFKSIVDRCLNELEQQASFLADPAWRGLVEESLRTLRISPDRSRPSVELPTQSIMREFCMRVGLVEHYRHWGIQWASVIAETGLANDVAALFVAERLSLRHAATCLLLLMERDSSCNPFINSDSASHFNVSSHLLSEIEFSDARIEILPRRLALLDQNSFMASTAGPTIDEIRKLKDAGLCGLLETNKSHAWTTFAELGAVPTVERLVAITPSESPQSTLRKSLASLYCLGCDIRWSNVEASPAERVPLPNYPFQRKRFWLASDQPVEKLRNSQYEVVWQRVNALPSKDCFADVVVSTVKTDETIEPRIADSRIAAEVFEKLNRLAVAWIDSAFEQLSHRSNTQHKDVTSFCRLLSLGNSAPDAIDREILSCIEAWKIPPRNLRLMRRLAMSSWNARPTDGTDTSEKASANSNRPRELAQEIIVAHPDFAAELTLLNRAGENLASVLAGEVDPLELLFPGGSEADVERLYKDSPLANLANELIAKSIRSLLERIPYGQSIRILEVGAGTGATTSYVLPVLPQDRTEYTFTDLSPLFLQRASQKFENNSFIKYALLDVERDPSTQGFRDGDFDLVIASNVLHATADLRNSLANVHRLMAPHGVLLLLETMQAQTWVDLIFGLTDGWWKFTDFEVRKHHPLIDSAAWQRLLVQEGFAQPLAVEPISFGPRTTVLIAQRHVACKERVAVVSDRRAFSKELASRLVEQGYEVVQWDTAQLNHTCSSFDLDSVPDKVLFIASDWEEDTGVETKPETGPVDMVHMESERAIGAAYAALRVLQWIAQSPQLSRTQVWLFTCTGLVSAEQTTGRLFHSLICGMGRVFAQEHPEQFGGLADLDPGATADEQVRQAIVAMHRNATGTAAGDELAFNDAHAFEAVIAPAKSVAAGGRKIVIDPDGTYVLIGGTGGLGLATSQWLIDRGARHLILTSRTGQVADTNRFIDRWRQSGIRVDLETMDVGDADQVGEAFRKWRNEGLRIKGLIHSAGVFNDRLLTQEDEAGFRYAMHAKVAGAWNLHIESLKLDLDFFCLYSSAASLLAPAGATTYCAANGFLDALARYRRQRSLPALSIDWGPWDNIGMAEAVGQARQQWWSASGVAQLSHERALDALEDAMGRDEPQVCILDVDWSRLADNFSSNSLPGRLRLVAPLRTTKHRPAPQRDAQNANDARLVGYHGEELRARFIELVRESLRLSDDSAIDTRLPFQEMGLDSLMSVELTKRLSRLLNRPLAATLLFEHSTIDKLVAWCQCETGSQSLAPIAASTDRESGIAIIGMSCQLPGGCDTPQKFWQYLLKAGCDTSAAPAERWAWHADDRQVTHATNSSLPDASFVDGATDFDAEFFGISPREAMSMDPQQRLLLENTWRAWEDAKLPPDSLAGSRTGVFVGMGANEYSRLLEASQSVDAYWSTGNSSSIAAGRLSYLFGLQGPSMTIDTACSSSLVALHLARESLLRNECDIAIVAGVNLLLSAQGSVAMNQMNMLSPDGKCKTFDEAADGFGRGEGCAVIVLRRSVDALRAGQKILAEVLGSAVNQDGRSSSLTAPNGTAQELVIREALASAKLSDNELSFLECHGTGTALGDPIEVQAISRVFHSAREQPLILGAVKANIGHLEAAAGLVGVIKTVLVLNHRTVPPQPHLNQLNQHIEWSQLPVVVPTTAMTLANADSNCAGVSSFGFSGTNANVIIRAAVRELHDAAHLIKPNAISQPCLLVVSAKKEAALRTLRSDYAEALKQGIALQDLCTTALRGRAHHNYRAALRCAHADDAIAKLLGSTNEQVWEGQVPAGHQPRYAFRIGSFVPKSSQWIDSIRRWIPDELHSTLAERNGHISPDKPSQKTSMREWLTHQVILTHIATSLYGPPSRILASHSGLLVAAYMAGALTLSEIVRIVHDLEEGHSNHFELRNLTCGIATPDLKRDYQPGDRVTLDAGEEGWQGPSVGASDTLPPNCDEVLISDQENDAAVMRSVSGNWLLDASGMPSMTSLANFYARGFELRWDAVASLQNGSLVDAPTYPFQRKKFWPRPVASTRQSVVPARQSKTTHSPQLHPLLGQSLKSPALSAMVFEQRIGSDQPALLADHALFGTPVVPATAYLEIMIAAARRLGLTAQVQIENLQIQHALLLDANETVTLQTLVRSIDGDHSIEIVSARTSESMIPQWRTHASARIKATTYDAAEQTAPDQSSWPAVTIGDDYYLRATKAGFQFGPRFRGLKSVTSNSVDGVDAEALGRVEFPIDYEQERETYFFHPGQLDACFQVLGATLPQAIHSRAYMPMSIELFRFLRQPTAILTSHVALRSRADNFEFIEVDIFIFNADHELVVEVRRLRLKYARVEALAGQNQQVGRKQRTPNQESSLDLTGLTPSHQSRALTDFVISQIRHVLDLEQDHPIDHHQPLTELGIDSFSAMELTLTLSRVVGQDLPPTLLYSSPSVHAIVSELLNMLNPNTPEQLPVDIDVDLDESLRQALDEIENASPEDIESDLDEILLRSIERRDSE